MHYWKQQILLHTHTHTHIVHIIDLYLSTHFKAIFTHGSSYVSHYLQYDRPHFKTHYRHHSKVIIIWWVSPPLSALFVYHRTMEHKKYWSWCPVRDMSLHSHWYTDSFIHWQYFAILQNRPHDLFVSVRRGINVNHVRISHCDCNNLFWTFFIW
jgi:hypothetical protein